MKCPTCGQLIPEGKPLDMKIVRRRIEDALRKTADRRTLLQVAALLIVELPQ